MTHTLSAFFKPDWDITFKFSIVHSSRIEWLDNFQYFEGDLHLIHQWGDEYSFPNNMTKHARSPVTYMLDWDNYLLLNDIDSFNKLVESPRSLIIVFLNIDPLSFLNNI